MPSKLSLYKTAALRSTGEFVGLTAYDEATDSYLLDGVVWMPRAELTDFCL